jgi:hypothetical protein
MVLTESDSNVILVEAMKNRTSTEMIRALQALLDRLHAAGITPTQHILDNECSNEFKATIKANNMSYQLVPPHDHRRNRAGKAIQTFKDHFIAILCGTDSEFPLHLWDLLLPQAEKTLNPTVSAYTYLWGQHDYNANPYAPLGCKVEAHVVPTIRETWAPHTTSGYYIGNSLDHYRCHDVYITDTHHTRTCSTVFFRHKYPTLPNLTQANALIRAADQLTDAIKGISAPPNITRNAIDQLIAIFKNEAATDKGSSPPQRVAKPNTPDQWVAQQRAGHNTTICTVPPLDVTYHREHPQQTPLILQDDHHDDASPPAANTRLQRHTRTITQDLLHHLAESPFLQHHVVNQHVTPCLRPPRSFGDCAQAVLDDKTGDLLEYRHLLKHPKYKDVWSTSSSGKQNNESI